LQKGYLKRIAFFVLSQSFTLSEALTHSMAIDLPAIFKISLQNPKPKTSIFFSLISYLCTNLIWK